MSRPFASICSFMASSPDMSQDLVPRFVNAFVAPFPFTFPEVPPHKCITYLSTETAGLEGSPLASSRNRVCTRFARLSASVPIAKSRNARLVPAAARVRSAMGVLDGEPISGTFVRRLRREAGVAGGGICKADASTTRSLRGSASATFDV